MRQLVKLRRLSFEWQAIESQENKRTGQSRALVSIIESLSSRKGHEIDRGEIREIRGVIVSPPVFWSIESGKNDVRVPNPVKSAEPFNLLSVDDKQDLLGNPMRLVLYSRDIHLAKARNTASYFSIMASCSSTAGPVSGAKGLTRNPPNPSSTHARVAPTLIPSRRTISLGKVVTAEDPC